MLLTTKKNELNWFSSFDKSRNIFIDTDDWEPYFKNCHHKFPVAHEIIANCLQQAMNLNIANMRTEKCIHMITRGCMNDFCGHKPDIAMKMRTADICKDCMQRLMDCGVQRHIVNAASEAFEGLRKRMKYLESFDWANWEGIIKVNSRRQIIFPELDNLEIPMNPLMKTLYLFYLLQRKNNKRGVSRTELLNYREELLKIYLVVSGHERHTQFISNEHLPLKEMLERIDELISTVNNSFNEKKSRIKDAFEKNIGENLAQAYLIKDVAPAEEDKKGRALAIELAPEKIIISENIQLSPLNWPLPPFPFRMSRTDKTALKGIRNGN